ncbi:MAG: ABC transporter permease [Lachnospiraceae bacterium]|nr:ABC transporter permease [Lachnospiraceae bacterium]
MIAVLEHELSLYYHSMKAYVFGAFLLMFTGIGALLYNINASVANFEYVLSFISIIFIILIPILTMRIMAEERSQKTDQLLFSLPISTTEIVIGKFLSMVIVFAIPVIIISFYPLIFAQFGEVYLPTSYGSIFAFFLLGLALMSIGMFISCLTESQSMAVGVCIVAMLFLYFCDSLANYVSSTTVGSIIAITVVFLILSMLVRHLTKSDLAGILVAVILIAAAVAVYLYDPTSLEGLLPNVMAQLSLFTRFETFVDGVFDLTAVVYDLSVITFFLFLCVQALEKRRYNG